MSIKGKVKNQLGLRNKFTFGKYKGRTISSVINDDPSYVYWCIKNVDHFNLSKSAKFRLDYTIELMEEEKYADLDELLGTNFF